MKKLLLTSALVGAIFATASQVKAIMFTDLDTINQKLVSGGSQNSYSGTFDITGAGFIPGYHTVSAAGITFSLTDDFGNPVSQGFTINLDGISSSSQYTSFLVLGTTQVTVDLLASLNSDGVLSYNIAATSGDFWLNSALLFADASASQSSVNTVPDGGSTLILSALAILALGAVQWRTTKHS